MEEKTRHHTSINYEIIFEGQMDALWAEWFEPLTLSRCLDGRSSLVGPLPDQAALRGVLERIFDLNLNIISLRRIG